ncbi:MULTISPECIES: DHH family phosphoesterase [Halomicrobium]|uniref:RecJ-like exonuclease n=2 Tax=Halomicrobium mukohataei TaxID=57705 RepID=C7NWZ7_HALMD|nr:MULTISPECIES: RecJ-like exonuclease [Halomicrobium]ACV46362.1 RecJ-like exonuclease [Halomicrobium mukohataei DSM 12286]QCD64917.1 recombinase RecJ [Halomicrobium mukohataei]QFR19723.1 recombinase RecJ [Halomicrobium sp. ZPS1]
MDDWLIDDERLSLERKSILPGEGFFLPDSIEEEEQEREAAEQMESTEVVVIADPDADGLACVALVREALGSGSLVPAGPHELDEALEWAAEYVEADATLVICDLCPDSESDIAALDDLTARVDDVRWYDHHQWNEDLGAAVDDSGVDRTVGDSDEVCTADVALAQLEYDFDDRFAELAAVTRDHDLWIRDDERSDDLADLSYWIEPEEYIEAVLEHGPDLSPEWHEFIEEKRVEKEALIEKAVERAQLRDVGEWTVGVTYGRCSQNEVAEALREQGADAAVIVKPAGSASIRGTETFERCHEVAAQVNGGGHPRAAGCKPDVYDDMLDYAHHWSTRGAVAKQAIVDAFKRLPEEPEAAE